MVRFYFLPEQLNLMVSLSSLVLLYFSLHLYWNLVNHMLPIPLSSLLIIKWISNEPKFFSSSLHPLIDMDRVVSIPVRPVINQLFLPD